MQFDWQTIMALLIVATAIAFMFRRFFMVSANKNSGCNSCSRCPKNEDELINLK